MATQNGPQSNKNFKKTHVAFQIERASDHSIWAVFKYETSHTISTVNRDTNIELFPDATLTAMKDFKFEGFDVETNLEAGWLFNWPGVQQNTTPDAQPPFFPIPGSQATDQPSFIEFLNLDTKPWTDVKLNISNHIQPEYNQVTLFTSNLSSYTALGLLYFEETATFTSATTYVSKHS